MSAPYKNFLKTNCSNVSSIQPHTRHLLVHIHNAGLPCIIAFPFLDELYAAIRRRDKTQCSLLVYIQTTPYIWPPNKF